MGTGNIPVSKDSSRAVELVIFNLSKQLSELGHDVTVIDLFSDVELDNSFEYKLVKMPKFLDYRVVTMPQTPKHFFKKVIFSLKAVSLLLKLNSKEKYDIIHVQNQYIGFFVLLFKKLLNLPVVYTSHIPFWVLNKQEFGKKLYFKTLLERTCFKLADKVICVGNSQKEGILEKISLKKEKIVTIENGVDLIKFHPSKKQNKKQITLISVARLSRVKNQFMLIKIIPDIIKENKKIKFIFIGQIEDEQYLEEIKNFIKEKKIEKYVDIVGPLSITELPNYYNQSEVFISTSTAEGLPLTVLEAMASKCALVLSDIGPHKEFQKENEIIFFKLDDSQDLAKKIDNLLGNSKKIEKLRNSSLKTARKYFSWNVVASKNLEIYKKLVNQ